MKKIWNFIVNAVMFFVAGKGDWMDEAIEEGLVDYSGQGRNRWGR